MTEAPRAAPLKDDRIMADGPAPSTIAMSHQPLATASVRDLMWRAVGLFRDREGLERAVATLEDSARRLPPSTPDEWREHNLLTVARLIAGAALRREESRGGHFRADFPDRDDAHWKIHIVDVRRAP
jgi:L-aspartate oxidase